MVETKFPMKHLKKSQQKTATHFSHMVTDIVTKTYTNHGTSAPSVENVTKLVPTATVMTKFATMVAKSKFQEVATMFTWNAPNSAVKIQNAKPSHSEIQTSLETVHSHACSWMKFTAQDQVIDFSKLNPDFTPTFISPELSFHPNFHLTPAQISPRYLFNFSP